MQGEVSQVRPRRGELRAQGWGWGGSLPGKEESQHQRDKDRDASRTQSWPEGHLAHTFLAPGGRGAPFLAHMGAARWT